MNRLILVAALGAALVFAQPQFPQSQIPQQQDQPVDPPSRVARLNWISGDVAFQPATVDTWTNATLNYPLTTGDHLFVNAGARAELHIDGSAIRLNGNSNFGFLNLSDDIAQMSLNEGSMEIRLRQLDQNDSFEIDTPNGAITLLRAGDYRIDTDPVRNSTMVTVRNGQAEMYQEGNSLLITAHQTAWFHDGSGPEVRTENLRDDFDTFTVARNNAEDMLPRRDYVPESMVGYQDLYAYGRWVNDPLYGWVWAPPVDAGWQPYSTGRWAFVEPWGWTWVDEAPWGFAPFHYGRWATVRGAGWVWIPGAPSYRPVYAPALVGFIGGGGFGVSVGWFPLGPREPWIPAWRTSDRYVNRVNVMHVTNINVVNVTNINYVNRQSVTVVSQADFAAARPVRTAAIRMSPGQLQGAQVLGTAPQIVPARASVAIGTPRIAPQVSARVVVAKTAPPPPPVSFQARQQALTQNRGLPLSASQVGQLRGQQPAAVVQRAPVRAIGPSQPVGGVAAPGGMNRPGPLNPAQGAVPGSTNRLPDRLNSRPPGAQPQQIPAAQSPLQGRPIQVTPPGQAPQAPAPQPQQNQPIQRVQPIQQPQPTQNEPQQNQRVQQPQQAPPITPPIQRVQPVQQPQPAQTEPQQNQPIQRGQQAQPAAPPVQRVAPSPQPAVPNAAPVPRGGENRPANKQTKQAPRAQDERR